MEGFFKVDNRVIDEIEFNNTSELLYKEQYININNRRESGTQERYSKKREVESYKPPYHYEFEEKEVIHHEPNY